MHKSTKRRPSSVKTFKQNLIWIFIAIFVYIRYILSQHYVYGVFAGCIERSILPKAKIIKLLLLSSLYFPIKIIARQS